MIQRVNIRENTNNSPDPGASGVRGQRVTHAVHLLPVPRGNLSCPLLVVRQVSLSLFCRVNIIYLCSFMFISMTFLFNFSIVGVGVLLSSPLWAHLAVGGLWFPQEYVYILCMASKAFLTSNLVK